MTNHSHAVQHPPFSILPLGEFMKKIHISNYFNIGSTLEMFIEMGEKHKDDAFTDGDKNLLISEMNKVHQMMLKVGLNHTANLIKNFITRIEMGHLGWREASALFVSFFACANSEMPQIFVGYIPAHLARYWKKKQAFGAIVPKAFPSTRKDIDAAGNCLAVEHFNACVFHLMRVVERGLLALAKERGIRKIGKSPIPIEWQEWGKIIRAIRAKADAIDSGTHRGPGKDAALEFYHGASGELEAFKDEYRNYISHGRKDYGYDQAVDVYHRVYGFMRRLSTRLSESQIGAIKWRKK